MAAAVCTTKVVFPPPPPTTNSLTSQQRKQLLRTTKKLSKVLGYAPHLVDTSDTHLAGPVLVNLPSLHENGNPSRRSLESVSSASGSTSSLSPRSSIRSSRSTSPTGSSLNVSLHSANSSPTRRPPILRLTRTIFSPVDKESISPTATSPPSPSSPSSESPLIREEGNNGYDSPASAPDSRYTLRIRPHTFNISPRSSLVAPPSFTIPTDSTLRRQKMERLRRKLGENVPVELVFPSTSSEDGIQSSNSHDDSDAYSQVLVIGRDESPTPTPRPVSMTRTQAKITKARDSLTLPSQRAKRRSSAILIKASRPAPPPPAAFYPDASSKRQSTDQLNSNAKTSKQEKRRSNSFRDSILKVTEVVQEDKIVVQVSMKELMKDRNTKQLGIIEESPNESPVSGAEWEWGSQEGEGGWENVARILAPRQVVRGGSESDESRKGLKRASWATRKPVPPINF